MIQLLILFVALAGGSPTVCQVSYGDLVHKFEFKEGDKTLYFFNIEDKENRAWLEVIPVTSSSLDTANKISVSREFGKCWKELKANEALLDAL